MTRTLLFLFSGLLVSSSGGALVARFNFDDSGNLGANTGSATTDWNSFSGVTQTTGRFGAGAGDFVAGTSSAWDNDFAGANLDEFALSMHVKAPSAADWKDFVSIGTDNNVVFAFEKMGAGGGVANYNIGDVGGVNQGSLEYQPGTGAFDISDGAWHHLGLNIGDGTLDFYVDGVNRGSAEYAGTGAISAFQLASRFGDGTRAIDAVIDDVAVYDQTLSDAQMSWLSSNAAIANPVPEPSFVLLGSLGALGLARRRR